MTKVTESKTAYIEKWDGGFYWLIDAKTEEGIDGDSRKRVVVDMAKRWGYTIVRKPSQK
jgi:hypothetical protein